MVACRDPTQMMPMTGVKGQSMSANIWKTERMIGRLEHKEGTRRTLYSVVGYIDCI